MKIQAAFNRPFCWPWRNKDLEGIFSFGVLSLNAFEGVLIPLRMAVYAVAVVVLLSTLRPGADLPGWPRDPRMRFSLHWFSLLGLLAILIPLFSPILHAWHRLSVYGIVLIVFALLDRAPATRRAFLVLAVLVQTFSQVLFLAGHKALIW